ncbi:hypothetical protein R83H12_03144 [Fibrobacteria bacterium R8-3-H12]
MLKELFVPLCFALLWGCASNPPKSSLFDTLEQEQCEADSFKGTGIENTEMEAIGAARSIIASQIQASLEAHSELTREVVEQKASSHFRKDVIQTYILKNASDAEVKFKKQEGQKIGIVACMTKSNAAKGFAEQLRPLADSLEFAAKGVIDAKHPKLKSEAWNKAKPLWGRFISLRSIVENLDREKSASFEPVAVLYAKARDGYLDFCQTAKMYWNPEQNDVYAEIAFSKLSENLKPVKASCEGQGISLVYKNTGHKCKYAGVFQCVYQPSLLIASCPGKEYKEYRLLENKNIEVYQKTEEAALEKLREKLRFETFWNEWEQEIKQWRPICE